jgi:hypothetical protein
MDRCNGNCESEPRSFSRDGLSRHSNNAGKEQGNCANYQQRARQLLRENVAYISQASS